MKDSTEYLVFQSVVIIINTKIIQPTGGTATMLKWIIPPQGPPAVDEAFYYLVRAVASIYSWGGVGQKFPNDEKNFRIFHGIRSHEGVCYPENEDAIYKQKYT